MSCEQSVNLITGVARRQGIAGVAAKSGFGGNTPQPVKPGPARRQKKRGTANERAGSAKTQAKKGGQASLFAVVQPAAKKSKQSNTNNRKSGEMIPARVAAEKNTKNAAAKMSNSFHASIVKYL